MSLVLETLRSLAERVATSHGLEIVDLELQGGGGKHRTLRIFLERNASGRAELARRLETVRRESARETGTDEQGASEDGTIVLDMVEAGETAGLTPDEDELAYLREVPASVPVAQLSGITHGDCERFSRDFGTALDVEDLMPGTEYLLEVSSPGLDRKLTRPEEFERFTGQLCKVQTFTPVGGNRHLRGRIGRVQDSILHLEPFAEKPARKKKGAEPKGGNAVVEVALANIEKAQLLPEF